MDGFINLLKPPGMTSSDAVVMVRRMLPRGTRVGHGGTLDPEAAGVLPIMVGRAARLFDYIVDKRKSYVAELCLGITTDTQDATGAPVEQKPVTADERDVRDALPRFVGEIFQIPPQYSAIKRGGKRLYEMARKGESVELAPRSVRVYALTYLGASGEHRHRVRVECGKGLYVRTLMHDIGGVLGCGGHMSFLLRDRAGYFEIGNALSPDEIQSGDLNEMLVPLDAPIAHLPRVDVGGARERLIRNGNPVRPDWIEREKPGEGSAIRVYCGGRFAGIGERQDDGLIRFKAMLLDTNPNP